MRRNHVKISAEPLLSPTAEPLNPGACVHYAVTLSLCGVDQEVDVGALVAYDKSPGFGYPEHQRTTRDYEYWCSGDIQSPELSYP